MEKSGANGVAKPRDFVMEGGCVLAAIEPYPPYSVFNGTAFSGSCFTIFDTIMKKLKLCYKLVRSPNGLWGNEFPNGSWTGLLGLTQRQEVEMIVCPVAPTYRRNQAIDFTQSVLTTDYSIVYPRPIVQPNFAGFVLPFAYETWLLLFFTVLLATGFSYILNKIFVRYNQNKINPMTQKNKLPNELWFNTLVSQPVTRSPEELGSRFLMAVWLLMTLIIGVIFKSNLKAMLIVPKVEVPFDNLKELVHQNDYEWSFLDGSIIPQYFKPAYESDPNSDMGIGWARRAQLYTSASQILTFVLEKKLACISISSKVKELMSLDFSKTGKCRLATARETLINIDFTFGVRKKSRMIELMNPYILNMRGMGIFDKMFAEHSANSTHCDVPPGKEIGIKLRSLTIVDFMGIFSILGGGYTLAIMVFIMEVASKKIKR